MAKEVAAAGQAAGAPAAPGAPAAQAQAQPKSRRKLLLIVVGALLLLLAGGGGAYFFLGGKKQEQAEAPPPPPPPPAVYYTLPELIVNLAPVGNRVSFLKMTLSLEIGNAADVPKVQSKMPRIVDNIQSLLRELRPEDVHGAQALARVREELLARVNQAAGPGVVHDILFQEVLLQ